MTRLLIALLTVVLLAQPAEAFRAKRWTWRIFHYTVGWYFTDLDFALEMWSAKSWAELMDRKG